MIYAHSLSGAYVYEDDVMVAVPRSLVADAATVLGNPVRSLSALSVSLTRALGGESAFADRVVSLGLHLFNGALVGLLARRWLSAGGAVVAMGVFWLHPLQTEAVAYLAARADLLAGTAVLLALVAADRGRLGWAWLASCAAIAAKEMAAPVWLLVPLTAWWRGQRWSRRQIAVWAVTVAAIGIVGLFELNARAAAGYMGGWASLAQAGDGFAMAASMALLVPASIVAPGLLTIDHGWRDLAPWMDAVAVIGWVALLVVAHRRQWPVWGWAVAVWAVWLAPRIALPLHDGLHERHLYVPMVGVALGIGAALWPHERTTHAW